MACWPHVHRSVSNFIIMWQVYQYGRGKLKLSKDLKTGQAHLRNSLIDQEEIDNMNKIYQQRKDYYHIDSTALTTHLPPEEPTGSETTAHLSYKEKVDLYRRKVQNEKLQNKYNLLFKKAETRRHKMRNPILFKLLQQFEGENKHDDSHKIKEDLKESQKYLGMIKINTNRKAHFNCLPSPSTPQSRPRFISLENGLPEKQQQCWPHWKDFLQGRIAPPSNNSPVMNLSQLEETFDEIINSSRVKSKKTRKSSAYFRDSPRHEKSYRLTYQPPVMSKTTSHLEQPDKGIKQSRVSCHRCDREQTEPKRDEDKQSALNLGRTFSKTKNEGRRAVSTHVRGQNEHKGATRNVTGQAEKTFTRSQSYSKDVINTMSNFYKTKHHKQQDYQQMVFHLKNDRPLTSDIRRKNYRVISSQNISQIKNYRSLSEKERLSIRNKNHQFYMELLREVEAQRNIEGVLLSGKVLERIREVLSAHYLLTPDHFEYIAQPSLYEPADMCSEALLARLALFIQQQQP